MCVRDSVYVFLVLYCSPVEVERDGKKREILHDHNDMFILHLSEGHTHTHTCTTHQGRRKRSSRPGSCWTKISC